ncbi:MAG: hypothetical protein GWO23_09255, partial [Gammaproteobacteria bacterium]|nr:hypothetical protein [Gammaproteobacteria bacterium]
KEHGVEFVFNYRFDFNLQALQKKGFDYILIGAGADKVRPLAVKGPQEKILPSHDVIAMFNRDPSSLKLGKNVVIVGAGDTAMDSARTALRVPGVEKVTL